MSTITRLGTVSEISQSYKQSAAYLRLESPQLVALDAPGETVALSGSGAAARGLLEGAPGVVTGFPCAPFTWAFDFLAPLAKDYGFYLEWSTNEKVALETAAAAAASGVRSAMVLKDFGINVMADSLQPLCYSGVNAGMVLVVVSEGANLSMTEMDSRYYNMMFKFPCLLPATVQETKDLIVQAFSISESTQLPVMVLATLAIATGRSGVKLGPLPRAIASRGQFHKDIARWNVHGRLALARKEWLLSQQKALMRIANELAQVQGPDTAELGVISCGVPSTYVEETLEEFRASAEVARLRLVAAYPLAEEAITKFVGRVNRVLVVEERDPLVEGRVKDLAALAGHSLEVLGKLTGHLPAVGTYTPEQVKGAVAQFLDKKLAPIPQVSLRQAVERQLPTVWYTNCPGCPHRASFYALMQALRRAGVEHIGSGGSGCYGTGAQAPFNVLDHFYCMGSSIGIASGLAHVLDEKTVVLACIGDTTFVHSGIPALINTTYTGAELLMCIMDNSVSASTAQQPTIPTTGKLATGEDTKVLKLEQLARACNVDYIQVVDPYRPREAEEAVVEALRKPGQRLIIFRRECQRYAHAIAQETGAKTPIFRVEVEGCVGCDICLTQLACPAITRENGKAVIDDFLCTGCGVCEPVCPVYAIRRADA